MTDLTIFGQPAQFIRHDGIARREHCPRRKRTQPIDLPSFSRVTHRPTLQIQELVAVSYGLHPRSMTSRNREKRIAWPRQIAMYLTRQLTERSLPQIGMAFGGRDHSTVIHAIRAVEGRIEKDPFVRADVEALREALAK